VRTTRCTTRNQHNGRAYHAGTTSFCTTERAQRAFKMRNVPHRIKKKGWRARAPDAERVGHQLPRAPQRDGLYRLPQVSKKQRSRREAVNCMPVLDGSPVRSVYLASNFHLYLMSRNPLASSDSASSDFRGRIDVFIEMAVSTSTGRRVARITTSLLLQL